MCQLLCHAGAPPVARHPRVLACDSGVDCERCLGAPGLVDRRTGVHSIASRSQRRCGGPRPCGATTCWTRRLAASRRCKLAVRPAAPRLVAGARASLQRTRARSGPTILAPAATARSHGTPAGKCAAAAAAAAALEWTTAPLHAQRFDRAVRLSAMHLHAVERNQRPPSSGASLGARASLAIGNIPVDVKSGSDARSCTPYD